MSRSVRLTDGPSQLFKAEQDCELCQVANNFGRPDKDPAEPGCLAGHPFTTRLHVPTDETHHFCLCPKKLRRPDQRRKGNICSRIDRMWIMENRVVFGKVGQNLMDNRAI